MDPFESVPEELKCPICFEMHEEKVFQCKNGHVLCENCYRQPGMKQCPQCRTPFGTDAIRSRVLEGILETLRIDCVYRDAGCRDKLDRKTIRAHVQNCRFKVARSSLKLCKLIGYPDCGFSINRGNATEAIQHFKSAHSFVFRDGGSVIGLEYANFEEIVLQNVYSASTYNNKANVKPGNLIGEPFILELKKEKTHIVIIPFFDRKEESMSWIPVCFPTSTGNDVRMSTVRSQIEFTISAKNGANFTELLNWRISPIDILKLDQFLPFYSPFRIPATPLIAEIGGGGSLFLKIKVKKSFDTEEVEGQNGQLDYFVVAASEVASARGADHRQKPSGSVEMGSEAPTFRPRRQSILPSPIAGAQASRRLSPQAASFFPNNYTSTPYYPRRRSGGHSPSPPFEMDSIDESTSMFSLSDSDIRSPTPSNGYGGRFVENPPPVGSSRTTSQSRPLPMPPPPQVPTITTVYDASHIGVPALAWAMPRRGILRRGSSFNNHGTRNIFFR